jgi:hypothetical protein
MNDDIPLPVIRAAEARALGSSLSAAAAEAGWALSGLRRWINRHPAVWYRALARARRDARDAACDEAVAFLRKHLRADEDKTSLQAAGSLTSRFAGTKDKPRATLPKDDLDQLRQLMAEVPAGVTTQLDLHLQASEEEGRATAAAELASVESGR